MSEHEAAFAEPARPEQRTRPTIVGIGASAGGLQALQQFFAAVPPESGLAFVVVVHLASDRESHLADLLQPHVPMPVGQVTETTPLETNHVYVIPPDHNLSAIDSHLRLTPLEEDRRDRAPVDHFFRTLAESFDGHAVAVILTGTGSDGAQGIRRIRERGGIVIVQDPAEAEFDGMPRSALESGVVDIVLPVAEIPRRIVALQETQPRVHAPAASGRAEETNREVVPRILTLVRTRTDHDFSRYKRSTVERRVERRMQLLGLEEPAAYLELLRDSAQETAALADDLLINVTSFFRDRAVFQYLQEHVVPALFDGKGLGNRLRVWSVGSATGEEAYSLGMLLLEEASRQALPPQIQIFASDLHDRSLRHAREGLYPDTIAADVTAERLERFFQKEAGGYRVRKELRERVVFAPHNVLRDPPFSHIDLVACRNVMIYLQREVQDEVLEVFHYALHGEGYLLLGTAEMVDRADLFRPESKEHHVYRRRKVAGTAVRVPDAPFTARTGTPITPPLVARVDGAAGCGAIHQRMVERYAPPSLLVDGDHNVLHVSENGGRYLQVPGGPPSSNVFRLVREELRTELRAALLIARERQVTSRSKAIPVRVEGELRSVVLRVSPWGDKETQGFALVMFDELGETPEPGSNEPVLPYDEATARELEAELEMTRSRLQALVEEYESSQEEMRAANEELQSANEELRSTMEELETSREELQSINEELQTANQENRHKVDELSQISSDLQNLLKVTDIATLFLDRALRINRFTPRVGELFNVRHSDRGRPLADITHRLGYSGLLDEAKQVLETLVPVEREVDVDDGRWFLIRVRPYRTTDDRIEGVVITLVDVSALKRTEAALRASEERQAFLLELADALRPLDDPAEIEATASRLLGRHLGVDRASYAEVEGEPGAEIGTLRGEYVREAAPSAPAPPPFPSRYTYAQFGAGAAASRRRGTSLVVADVNVDPLFEPDARAAWAATGVRAAVVVPLVKAGRFVAEFGVQSVRPRRWTSTEVALVQDVAERTWSAVERARAEAIVHQSEAKYRALFESMDEGFVVAEVLYDAEGRPVDAIYLEGNPAASRMTGVADYSRRRWSELMPGAEAYWLEIYERVARTGVAERLERYLAPIQRWYDFYISRVGDADPGRGVSRVAVVFQDVTARKQAADALRASETRYRMLVENVAEHAIFLVSPAGLVTEWTSSAEAVKGYSAAEVLGQHVRMFYTAEDVESGEPARELAEAASTGRSEREAWRVRKGGKRFWVNEITTAVRDSIGAVTGFTKVCRDLTEQRAAADAAERARVLTERDVLRRTLAQAEEDERRRLARELHDEAGQRLTALGLGLQSLSDVVPAGSEADRRAAQLRSIADTLARELHALAVRLRPKALDDFGLEAALTAFAEGWSVQSDIPVDVHVSTATERLPPEIESAIYRIVQEALTNVAKHSGAQHASVVVERRDGNVVAIVEDDGRGFDQTMVESHATSRREGTAPMLGLLGVRERAALFGGSVEVESTRGSGTTLFARIPVSRVQLRQSAESEATDE